MLARIAGSRAATRAFVPHRETGAPGLFAPVSCNRAKHRQSDKTPCCLIAVACHNRRVRIAPSGGAAMTQTVMLFDPTAARAAIGTDLQRALPGLAGKVVGFIDNTKPNFNHLAADMSELLVSKYGVKRVVTHQKRNASVAAADDVITAFAGACDLVIAGSGD
jgi:hypothetical protein